MRSKSAHKMPTFKTFRKDFVELHHRFRYLSFDQMVSDCEIIIVVEHVEVVDGGLVGDVTSRK